MSNEVVTANEISEVAHNLTTGPCILEHCIGDSSIGFDKSANALPGIHQLLKSPCYLAVINSYCPDLDGTIADTWGQARGLEIEDNYCISYWPTALIDLVRWCERLRV